MLPSLEQTDNEILADLKGSRTLEVLIRVLERGQQVAGDKLERACNQGESNVDGLARTWATWGHVLKSIVGEVNKAQGDR